MTVCGIHVCSTLICCAVVMVLLGSTQGANMGLRLHDPSKIGIRRCLD